MGIKNSDEEQSSLEKALNEEIKKQGLNNIPGLKNARRKLIEVSKLVFSEFQKQFSDYTSIGSEENFAERMINVCKAYYSEDSGSDGLYLRRCFNNLIPFIEDVVVKPTLDLKVGWETQTVEGKTEGHYSLKQIVNDKDKTVFKHFLHTKNVWVDTLSLILHLIGNYHKKQPQYSKQDGTKEPQIDLVPFTFPEKIFADNHKSYCAKFSPSIWRTLYHNVETCKFNGGEEMIASMLDCVDPHINHLLFMPAAVTKADGKEVNEDMPAEVIAILVDMIDEKTKEKYLAVEGMFGIPKAETPEETKRLLRHYHEFAYDCICEIAIKTGRGLFFNMCFTTGHVSQGSIEFINYVCEINGLKVPYKKIRETEEGIEYELTTKYKPDHFPHNLAREVHVCEEGAETHLCGKAYATYRRSNTHHDYEKYLFETARNQRTKKG